MFSSLCRKFTKISKVKCLKKLPNVRYLSGNSMTNDYKPNKVIQPNFIRYQYHNHVFSGNECRATTDKAKVMILDWSGTLIDDKVQAVIDAIMQTFASFGVNNISEVSARLPMGAKKDVHIKDMMLEDILVKNAWKAVHGYYPAKEDCIRVYNKLEPLQINLLHNKKYTKMLPNTLSTLQRMRETYGLLYGVTSGFTKIMQKPVLDDVKIQGFVPDSVVAPDEVGEGRPSPKGMYANMINLGGPNCLSVIKVGDTLLDIKEGNNAGAFTVGLPKYGNEMGIFLARYQKGKKFEELNSHEQIFALHYATQSLEKACPDYIVHDFSDLFYVVKDINERLALGDY